MSTFGTQCYVVSLIFELFVLQQVENAPYPTMELITRMGKNTQMNKCSFDIWTSGVKNILKMKITVLFETDYNSVEICGFLGRIFGAKTKQISGTAPKSGCKSY